MNKKAFLIDLCLLFVYGILLFLFLYFGYDHIYTRRVFPTIIILLSIPICWGTFILSIMGKNTIGNRIVKKKNRNNC